MTMGNRRFLPLYVLKISSKRPGPVGADQMGSGQSAMKKNLQNEKCSFLHSFRKPVILDEVEEFLIVVGSV